MSKGEQRGNPGQKDRQRMEIARDIEEFIAAGGRIDILSDTGHQMARRIGSAWHAQEPPLPGEGGSSHD